MLDLTVGTDTYGKVKSVGGMPIVTHFRMLHFLPLFPLTSYYCVTTTRYEESLPFSGGIHEAVVEGFPLAKCDKTSVVMAYARGLFAALTVLGFIGSIFTVITYFSSGLDTFGLYAMRGALSSLAIGAILGLATYFIPTTNWRERQLRRECGSFLGHCIDPARLTVDAANYVLQFTDQPPTNLAANFERCALLEELIKTRVQIAIARESNPRVIEELEDESHSILIQLDLTN